MQVKKRVVAWCALLLTGLCGGLLGALFHLSLDVSTRARQSFRPLLFALPLAGLLIVGLYRLLRVPFSTGTHQVLSAVRGEEPISPALAPAIFGGAVLTHLCGGSAGREGAALQLGGSLGSALGRLFRLPPAWGSLAATAGMSAVFSALFGTPFAAAFFCAEVLCVRRFSLPGLAAGLVGALPAAGVARLLGVAPVRYQIPTLPGLSPQSVCGALVLTAGCVALALLFCTTLRIAHGGARRLIPNAALRIVVGGLLLVGLSLCCPSGDYNGAGADVIARAVGGDARPEAFALKLVFTALTLAAGYRGGEIVPVFFLGSTFGAAFGGLLGLPPGFAASLGMMSCFCAATKTPLASFLMALELFSGAGALWFLPVCALSFFVSGRNGLYGESEHPFFPRKREKQSA